MSQLFPFDSRMGASSVPQQELIVTNTLIAPTRPLPLNFNNVKPMGALDYNPADGNLYVSNGLAWSNIGGGTRFTVLNILVTNLTSVNIVSTSLTTLSALITSLTAISGIVSNLSSLNGIVTNLTILNAVISNLTSLTTTGNLVVSNLTAINAFISNLTAINNLTSNLSSINSVSVLAQTNQLTLGNGATSLVLTAPVLAATRTYTLPDALNNVNVLLGVGQTTNLTTIATTSTLLVSQSGDVVFVNSTGVYSINLPGPAANTNGASFRFIVAATPLGGAVTITNQTGAKIFGVVTAGDAAAIATNPINGRTSIIFATNSAVGDWVNFISDGANWYISGSVAVHTTITTA